MKNNAYIRLFFAALLAFTVSTFVYFGFVNSYSSTILNFNDFSGQFSSGIYQYRKLSGYLLFGIYDFLGSLNLDYSIFKLNFLHPDAEPQMYLSFYLLNTFFTVLAAAVMVFITETSDFCATVSEKILLVTACVFTIALTQFVILPYDCSSYFFLLLFFLFLIRFLRFSRTPDFVLLCIIILISTYNRESSALSLSLAATLLFSKYGLKKQTLFPLTVLVLCFLVVYLGLRFTGTTFTTNDGSLVAENFSQPKNYLGMLFWGVFLMFSLMISKDSATTGNILLFHLLSLPYILMCFYTGILYEARLYVPLFLTGIFLSRYELPKVPQN